VSDAPIRFVCGIRGRGKTCKARELVKAAPRLLACDPMAEYDALALEFADFREYLDTYHTRDRYRVALVEPGWEEWFTALAWETAQDKRGLTVVLEEADMIARPGAESESFRHLCARGRHFNIDLVICSRRPAEVSRLATAMAAEFYVFQTQEPADLKYLASMIGGDAAELVPQLAPATVTAAGVRVEYLFSNLARWERRTEVLPLARRPRNL